MNASMARLICRAPAIAILQLLPMPKPLKAALMDSWMES